MKKTPAAQKKNAARRKKDTGERLAKFVTFMACAMATTYVVLRIINWIRFL